MDGAADTAPSSKISTAIRFKSSIGIARGEEFRVTIISSATLESSFKNLTTSLSPRIATTAITRSKVNSSAKACDNAIAP